jgi:hypothetical protein
MKSLIASCILSTMVVLGFSVPAFAYVGQTGENAGRVASLTTNTLNGETVWEVTISGLGTLCPGRNFAYVGTADRNGTVEYNAMLKAEPQSNLYIYWIVDANSNCHITHLYW